MLGDFGTLPRSYIAPGVSNTGGLSRGDSRVGRRALVVDCAHARSWPAAAREVVEAGGVEPPSEKPCHRKPTCLADSV